MLLLQNISESGCCRPSTQLTLLSFLSNCNTLHLLLHPQPCSVCTEKCCCKNNFTPCFDLAAQSFISARVQRTEVGLRHWAGGRDVRSGMGSGLPGLGRTWVRARTESQLLHRGPCPSYCSFFSNIENSIFVHKFKVPSGLPHFCIINH